MDKRMMPLVVSVFLLVGAGCASTTSVSAPAPAQAPSPTPSQAPAPSPTPAPAPAPTSQNTISITGFAFAAKSLTVAVGTTVVWTNQDPMGHTVTADDGSFDSGTIASGATYSHAFAKAGVYTYHCAFHPSMLGTVIVQ